MKKLTVLALAAALATGALHAQTPAPAASAASAAPAAPAAPTVTVASPASKKELVARVLVLQRPAVEQVAQAIVERPAIQMQQQAFMALQARVPPEKREAVAKSIQADLKKYVDDVSPGVRQQAIKLATTTVGTMLEDKFTEDELKQLLAIMESPVNRKFTQMGGEFQKALGEKLVAQTQSTVGPKVKALEQSIAGHLGLPTAPATKASEPGAKAPKK